MSANYRNYLEPERFVSLTLVSKTVRRVSAASLILLICAAVSYYAGERGWQRDAQRNKEWMASGGFYISEVSPETNLWLITAGLFLLVSISLAIAALMLWRQDRDERH